MALSQALVADVITTVKLFGGDVFGGVVRDARVAGRTEFSNVDARIDAVQKKGFLTLLHVKYDVRAVVPGKVCNGVQFESYRLRAKFGRAAFDPIELDVAVMTPKMFRVSFVDFDVNLFAENDSSLYMRCVPYSLKFVPDKVSFLKDRIAAKTFACLDSHPKERSLADLWSVIDKAEKMTLKGWTMDDAYGGTWIVGRWGSMILGKNRRRQVRDRYVQMVGFNECSFCHDRFKGEDVVFNGACNHNFHWKCGVSNGLCYWIKNHGQSSCPYCRSDLFEK